MLTRLIRILLIVPLLITYATPRVAIAGNNWGRGNTVGLCAGTQIRHGPGYGYAAHTTVPENNWPVKVIDGPRYANGQTWWDTSRREIDGGGTGWVAQSDADRCFSSPPPQPPPAPPPNPPSNPPTQPPVPGFTCVGTNIDFRQWTTGPLNFQYRGWYTTYNEYKAAVTGGRYCSNLVTKHDDGFSFTFGNSEVTFDNQRKLIGTGVTDGGRTGYNWGLTPSGRGFWHGPEYTHSAKWPYPNTDSILNLDASQEILEVYEPNPPQPNWSYAYRQLQVIAISGAIIAIVVAAVALAGASLPAAAFAAIVLMVASTMGVTVSQPTAFSSVDPSLFQPSQAQTVTIEPELIDMLRQSYGPLVDTIDLRPMNIAQVTVLARDHSVRVTAASASNEVTLPAIDFQADGFAPNNQVLVAVDRAGKLVAETSVQVSASGEISGSLILNANEATQAGMLTVIAVDEQQIEQRLDQLATSLTSNTEMDFATAALTIAPAPRLISDVTFDPWPIVAGRVTTATYTVRNFGDVPVTLKRLVLAVRGPDCAGWCDDHNADWPVVNNVTLAPGSTHTVSTQRFIEQPGRYLATVVYQDINDAWQDVEASPRFNLDVQPGIVILEGLTISPTAPLAGEVVTVRFGLKNASSQPLMLSNIVADGRGPNCTNGWECTEWANTPPVYRVLLAPGQYYIYQQSRILVKPGNYFFEPVYQFEPEYWHLLGSRLDFRVGNGIRVARPLQLDPTHPAVGVPVNATYTLRNEGHRAITIPYIGVISRGPNCEGSSWECLGWADWPWVDNIRLEAGQEYTYSSVRSLETSGDDYWAEPHIADFNPWWTLAYGGERTTFAVQPGIELIDPLTLTPSNPVVGELVTARAAIRNNADQPITLDRLFVGAQGPNCQDFNCTQYAPDKWGDFPPVLNLVLQPGQTYNYSAARLWLHEGNDYIAQFMYVDTKGGWHTFSEKTRLNVGKGLQITQGLQLTPSAPTLNETYTGTFSVYNAGPRPLVLPAIGVGGRDANCDDVRCHNNAGMSAYFTVTLPVGSRYDYVASRMLDTSGTYYVEPFILAAQPDWWTPLSALSNGQRITFTVGNSSPPVTELLPCSMTIERGAIFINTRDVHLSLNVPDASALLVSNDGGFVGAIRMPYTTELDWELPDIGQRITTLLVRIRPLNDKQERLCNSDLSDEIILDSLPPTVLASWAPEPMAYVSRNTQGATASTRILQIEALDQIDGSGIAAMQISTHPNFPDPAWEPFQASRAVDVESSSIIYIRVRDRAGNVSSPTTVHIATFRSVFLPLVSKR